MPGARRGWVLAVALVVLAAGVGVAVRGLVRHNNWYLASDQYAFLTFAADLQAGTVFHDASALERILPRRWPDKTYDALSQTYFWRGESLYSRYPPGFPALLALAGALGGEVGQHVLNPVLYVIVLFTLVGLVRALLREDGVFAWVVGATTLWLLILMPTGIHLWGITVARDLPCHWIALVALWAAWRRHFFWASLALGLACTIRPDALLYGLPIGLLLLPHGPSPRDLGLGAFAFLVGVAPLLAYNTITQGHPFAFTQGGEFVETLSAAPRTAVYAQAFPAASGGAFRLSNLLSTLPGNLAHLGRAFGALLIFGVVGVGWAWTRRPDLVRAFLPYPVIAVPFYSCWSHADSRYLVGVALCLLPLVGLGLVVTARAAAEGGWRTPARVGALVLAVIAIGLWGADATGAWVPGRDQRTAILGLGLVALVPPGFGRRHALAASLVPVVALAGLTLARVAQSSGGGAAFPREQVERARIAVRERIEPGSLVLVGPGLGRPAENLRVYAGLDAFYPGEISLLGTTSDAAVILHVLSGRRAYYLLRADDRFTAASTRKVGRLMLRDRRTGVRLLDWFVDPRAARAGAILFEVEIPAEQRRLLQQFKAYVEGDLPPPPDAPSRSLLYPDGLPAGMLSGVPDLTAP